PPLVNRFFIFFTIFVFFGVTVHGYPVNSYKSGSWKVAFGEEPDFGYSNLLACHFQRGENGRG
ncbi:MAG: hypothetical protein Q4D55_09120, partial [Eubacteriales bacterium]|nr:hypothetical protein [Eubacteriales bacterium]